MDNSVVSTNGIYEFKVKAIASDGNYNESEKVSVEIITGTPGTPTNYDRDGDSCTVTFKTANNNGETTKVIMYCSKENSFFSDDSTKIAEVLVGSNEDKSLTDSNGNCEDYFYVIRAFNKESWCWVRFIGDEDIEIKTKTKTKTTVKNYSSNNYDTGAIPVAGGGEVAGEQITPREKEKNNVITENAGNIENAENKNTEGNVKGESFLEKKLSKNGLGLYWW